jgi:DNA sulfur modification protein DndD
LSRDGRAVDDLPESAWQDFLDGLVPPGVANLFLFDGERIQALAEDESGERLGEAVRRLLGLDLVGRLRDDLARYASRHGGSGTDALLREFSDAETSLRAAEARLEELRIERTATEARRVDVAAAAGKVRAEFAQIGGLLAVERSKLEATHRKALDTAASTEGQVRELVTGLLPFAICPEIAIAVERRLVLEREHEEREIIRARLQADEEALAAVIRPVTRGKSVATAIHEVLFPQAPDDQPLRVHDLTASERAVLSDQLRRLREDIPKTARRLSKRLSKAEEERTRTRELLDKAPPESDVAEPLLRLQELEREVGALDAELSRLDDELQRAEYEHRTAARDLKRASERVSSAGDVTHRAALAVRTHGVLQAFEARVQTSKLTRIEIEAARFFNRLSRKGQLLGAVAIDPGSFKVSLRRWDETELPKERLSAGEKQLLAISLLWALARVSGRPLPVVIDTPLARLDRAHREHLLRDYFPHVSHQVVVLSTDTEVDAAAAAELAPSVARAFHLDHDSQACATTVNDGYFFPTIQVINAR